MNIDILIHTSDIRQHLKVSKRDSAVSNQIIITSVRDERDYNDKNSVKTEKETTIRLDETGARQLMLALQKILW